MAIYKPQIGRAIVEILPEDRLSNQVVFSGNSGNTISVPNGIVFLELLQVDSGGTVQIDDGDGNTISTSISDFAQDHSPLRCDKGITITGDVDFAKGFVIYGVFVTA